jgi:hypothetical protein
MESYQGFVCCQEEAEEESRLLVQDIEGYVTKI